MHQGQYRDEAALVADVKRYAGARERGGPPRRRARRDGRAARPAPPRLLRRAGRAEARGDRRARRRRDPPRRAPDDGRVVGTCRLLFVDRTVQFSRLAVEPDARRAGIATALLHEADREAAAARARADRAARADVRARAVPRRRLRAARTDVRRGGDRARRDGEAPVSEVRVDPLTGLRAIVAGDRANRPERGPERRARARRSTRPATRSPKGNEAKTPPEVYALRTRDGGRRRLARLEGARRAQPLPGAVARRRRAGAGRGARPLHRRSRRAARTR